MKNSFTTVMLSSLLCMVTSCGGDDDSRLDEGVGSSSSANNSSSNNSSASNSIAANPDLPDTPFSERSAYVLADFDLETTPVYWEVRRGPVEGPDVEEEPVHVLYSYDSSATEEFTQIQIDALAEAESSSGFGVSCLPMYCPIYGVIIEGNEAQLLTTESELLAFFGNINSEAELNLWLYANEYYARTYQEVDGGYEVVAAWDDSCGENGEDLLFVDTAGVITKLETLWSEEDNVCA